MGSLGQIPSPDGDSDGFLELVLRDKETEPGERRQCLNVWISREKRHRQERRGLLQGPGSSSAGLELGQGRGCARKLLEMK